MSEVEILRRSNDQIYSPILWPNSSGRKKGRRRKPQENQEPSKLSLKYGSCEKPISAQGQKDKNKLKRRSSVETFTRVYNEIMGSNDVETDDAIPSTPTPQKLKILARESSSRDTSSQELKPYNKNDSPSYTSPVAYIRRTSLCRRLLSYGSNDSNIGTPTETWGCKDNHYSPGNLPIGDRCEKLLTNDEEVIEISDSASEDDFLPKGGVIRERNSKEELKISPTFADNVGKGKTDITNSVMRLKVRVSKKVVISSSDDEIPPPLSQRIASFKTAGTKLQENSTPAKDDDSSDDEFNRILEQMRSRPRRKPVTILSDSDSEKTCVGNSSSDHEIENTPPGSHFNNRGAKPKRLQVPCTMPRMKNTQRWQPLTPQNPTASATPAKVLSERNDANVFLTSLSFGNEGLHPLSSKYHKNYKKTKEELASLLYDMFNKFVFDSKLPEKMKITWNPRMTKTAGFCYYRREASAPDGRSARIELSLKVLDNPDRLRDTMIHELCHAAGWIIYGYRDGHGLLWKYWAQKASVAFPSLPIISRCHTYEINTKYTYKCQGCGGCIGRHTKSLDITRKVCSRCGGRFKLLINGRSASEITPKTITPFALFVKENYGKVKSCNRAMKHADVMKTLSSEFAAKAVVS